MTDQPEPAPGLSPTVSRPNRRTGLWVGIGAAALVLVGAAIAIPVSIANAQAAEEKAAEQAAREAELERLATFTSAMNECEMTSGSGVEILDLGEAINLTRVGKYDGPEYEEMLCVLEEIGAPSSLESKIAATRALDGVQRDDWAGFTIEWRYHPDDGATVLIEHAK